jgi:hypothetical protein
MRVRGVAVKCSRLCKHSQVRFIKSPNKSLTMMIMWHSGTLAALIQESDLERVLTSRASEPHRK